MNRVIILAVALLALFLGIIGSTPTYAGGATFTVNTTGDLPDSAPGDGVCNDGTGACSLRAAIEQANQDAVQDMIAFNIPNTEDWCNLVTDVCVIHPLSALPIIGLPVIIDGTTQPGFAGLPLVALDGFNENIGQGAGALLNGLQIEAGNSTVRGMIIRHFGTIQGSDGIELRIGDGNTIAGNFIGTDDLGERIYYTTTPAVGQELGNRGSGVNITGGSANNVIGGTTAADRNVISGNFDHGVRITASSGNTVAGNYIGTNFSNGTKDLGNGITFPDNGNGVRIELNPLPLPPGTSTGNVIGGTTAGARNLISGNNSNGVLLKGGGVTGNSVQGNYIGLKASGIDDLANQGQGILIDGAPSNTVGGNVPGSGNVISGNFGGVRIQTVGATGNLIAGNIIGLDPGGTIKVSNLGDGVAISGVGANTVGGTTAAARNVISGNGNDGVDIAGGVPASGNVIQGNYIGTNAAGGVGAVGNGNSVISTSGVKINNVPGTIIGGTAPGAGNVISNHFWYGIDIVGTGSTGTQIQGNFIGTNHDGTVSAGNLKDGILITNAKDTVIGGTTAAARNIISGNGASFFSSGIVISGSTATGTLIQGNYIGTDVTGLNQMSNSNDGVLIVSAPNNTVGGTSTSARNILSGNGGRGVEIAGAAATGNKIQGNYIGLAFDGDTVLGNDGDGIFVSGSPANVIGGAGVARNVISGNDAAGIQLLDSGSSANSIVGNYIGTDAGATMARGNISHGVFINGASNTTVGGPSVSDRNIISGNNSGVYVNGVTAAGNDIVGNFIGTNATATGPLGNLFDGVRLSGLASDNVIGGPNAADANVIAYNGGDGVVVDATGGTGNRIQRSTIFSNLGLGIDLFPDGVTANDLGSPPDQDTGPNNLQNYPDLTSANSTLSGTTIAGSLSSTPNTTFSIFFFSDVSCDPSGFGEGRTFIGSASVATDGAGNIGFNVTVPGIAASGEVVNATATDPAGNTSEFSQCQTATGVAQPSLKQGDVNCDNLVNSVDALLVLRFGAGLSVNQNDPCPDIATVLTLAGVFGDVDCTGAVSSVDALKVLRFVAGLPVAQTEPPPCTDLGQVLP